MISKQLGANDELYNVPGPQAFQFSAVNVDSQALGATEYTIDSLIWDKSGSVASYAQDLEKCLKESVQACAKSPRADNLMLRALLFNSNLDEIFGFKELKDIDINKLPRISPNGTTALLDAIANGVGATIEYSKKLVEKFYAVNGVIFVMTDGDDNASSPGTTLKTLKAQFDEAQRKEVIDSLTSILIGIEDPQGSPSRIAEVKKYLDNLHKKVGFDAYLDMGKVTPQRLAKLAQFVSQSVSSASQNLQQTVAGGATSSKSSLILPTF